MFLLIIDFIEIINACIVFDCGKNPVSALAMHLNCIGHTDHINTKVVHVYSSVRPKC